MQIKTFRAKTMQQALNLVRHELGPDASVLHTRELNGGLVRRMVFGRQYEVAASTAVNVPSRLPATTARTGIGARRRGCLRIFGSATPRRSIITWPGKSIGCRK